MADKVKILVVDDGKENVELLVTLLTVFGFEALKAYSGKDAIEIAGKARPAMVLLDIMMPEMDGIQVCGALRKDPGNAQMAIVMVTAKDKDSDIVRALEMGADDYIMKPVSKKDLIVKVDNLLAKAKAGELPSQLYLKDVRSEQKKKDDR
ncbi:MAG: response regulator [Candidatus Omnitrophota bacterium]|nr:response regulator [Candidatus Omnitrophota bacterium]